MRATAVSAQTSFFDESGSWSEFFRPDLVY
jgi:hypothetical protein